MLKPIATGRIGIAFAAALAALAGCIDGGPPSQARVVVETSPAAPLQLVISTSFGTVQNPETGRRDPILITADTTMVTGDFDQQVSISGTLRIFVELRNTTGTAETAHMRVFLDDQIEYDVTDQIADGEFLRYMFTSRDFS